MRFIFAFQPGPGHWSRTGPIVSTLRRHGHEVIVATSESFRQHIDGSACDGFIAIGPSWEEDLLETTDLRKPRTLVDELRTRGGAIASYFFGAACEVSTDLAGALRQGPAPDMLVFDYTLLGGPPTAEAMGLPWAVVFGLTVPFHLDSWPPFGSHYGYARTPFVRDRYQRIESSIMRENRELYGPITTLWQKAGQCAADPWRPYEHLGRLGIVGSIKECEFPLPEDFPAHIRYVGPLLEERQAEGLDSEAAAFVNSQTDYPLIHLTLGMTFSRAGQVLQSIVNALKDDSLRLMISSGHFNGQSNERFPASARARMLMRPVLPHAALMPAVDLLICHGGAGTLMKALYFGVPVLIVPLGAEQRSNAARLVHAGIGKMILPAHLTVRGVREAVRTLLDPAQGFIRRAKEMGEKARQAGGAEYAASLLEAACEAGG